MRAIVLFFMACMVPLSFLVNGCTTTTEKRIEYPWVISVNTYKLKGPVKSIILKEWVAVADNGRYTKGVMKGDPAGEFREFNKYGLIIKETANGKQTIFKYADDGTRPEEWQILDANSSIIEHTRFTYNGKGLMSTRTTTDSKGNVIESISFDYDDRDRKIVVNLKTSQSVSKWVYKYTGDKLYSETICTEKYPDGINTAIYDTSGYEVMNILHNVRPDTLVYTNDNMGNILNTVNYYAGKVDTILVYSYTYDKLGSWIERITYKHGIATAIAERTIQYY